ncbi:AcrR family transcriptional regulator [Chitinivorax tropicus]|uniref:AcrR family transcriptional regulator n=1 Tax=Chitinivorax tropicus TaxID=714531 RepID=A0A840MSB9_9PROT|nr:TetR/AcrR family transcriptional regulator [Chitinivorax tropicus]MBB5019306.1 AcrR family transcriptional regulator [Chitinivorax tropicus]
MEPGRRERKKVATHDLIIDIAMALFDREGFDEITMERIAAEADVAKATLYKYFPVKEAILAGYIRRENTAMVEPISQMLDALPDSRSRLCELYSHLADWFSAHRTYVARYIAFRLSTPQPQGSHAQRSGFDAHLRLLLEKGQQQGDITDALPLPQLVASLELMMLSPILFWLNTEDADLRQLLMAHIDLFLDGAANIKG